MNFQAVIGSFFSHNTCGLRAWRATLAFGTTVRAWLLKRLMYVSMTCVMKKIFLITVIATLALSSCSRNSGEAKVNDDDPNGSFGAAAPDDRDSANNPNRADSAQNDGYKADSITQSYPIPR